MRRCRAGSVTRAIACGSLYLFPIAVSLCLDPRRMYRAIQALGGYRGYYFCVVYPPRRTRRRRGNVAALPHACLRLHDRIPLRWSSVTSACHHAAFSLGWGYVPPHTVPPSLHASPFTDGAL